MIDFFIDIDLGCWRFGGVSKNRKRGKWRLDVRSTSNFETILPFLMKLNRRANYCEMMSYEYCFFNLVDEQTEELKIVEPMNRLGNIHLLRNVKNLVFNFEQTQESLKIFAKFFPQFSRQELIESTNFN